AEGRAEMGGPGQPERDGLRREHRPRPRPDAGPLEPHRDGDERVLLRRQLQRRLEQGVAEVGAFEVDPQLQPRGAQPVVVGVVDIEREVERATRQPDAGDLDLLQLDIGLSAGTLNLPPDAYNPNNSPSPPPP